MASRSTQAAAKRGSYQKYTVKQRKAAVRDADTLGVTGAASKHGIPPSTLGNWWVAKAKRRSTKKAKPPAEQRVSAATAMKLKEVAPRVAKSYTPSQRAKILEYAAGHSVTEAHKKFDVSRFTIYDWRRKVGPAAEGKGDSPTSGPSVEAIERSGTRRSSTSGTGTRGWGRVRSATSCGARGSRSRCTPRAG